MTKRSLRWLVGRALDVRVWNPTRAFLVRDQLINRQRNEHAGLTDRDHLVAAAEWLARAQDATRDGGVSGRYQLHGGWSSSYPETTGYIIPTFLALANVLGDDYRRRAERCVDFLLPLQLSEGAFPGGEIDENRRQPSVFNTAQILHGLVAWHRETKDSAVEQSARRAADWLVSIQDPDGAWRENIYHKITTYTAHASCWLGEAGKYFGEAEWIRAAGRHLDWVLSNVNRESGWINLAGFGSEDHRANRAVTHTLAYTIWGILHLSQTLGRYDALGVARVAAAAVMRRLELSRWLPGEIDSTWRAARSDYACLTGNAQMALIWLWLAEIDGDPRFTNAALKAIDLVKTAQAMTTPEPGILGGIPGSAPIWGDYIYMALPNWAAKYFIDALLAKAGALETLARQGPLNAWDIPADLPRSLPAAPGRTAESIRVVLLSSRGSHKVPQMMNAWSEWGFHPAAVVLEESAPAALTARLSRRVQDEGIVRVVRNSLRQRLARSTKAASPGAPSPDNSVPDIVRFCKSRGIPVVFVRSLGADAAAALHALEPHLFVHAGGGIVRRDVLALPTMGTLNAHMGILPRYRGMNVAEWAVLERGPLGCTVHLIDEGIDTGDILLIDEIDANSARSIADLRRLVDAAQIRLLGRVLRFIVETASLPRRRSQATGEGHQYFRMHPDLRMVLERKLAAGLTAAPR